MWKKPSNNSVSNFDRNFQKVPKYVQIWPLGWKNPFNIEKLSLTLKDNSLNTAEILAATSTGAGEAKIKSSVGALFDFLPQAIKL